MAAFKVGGTPEFCLLPLQVLRDAQCPGVFCRIVPLYCESGRIRINTDVSAFKPWPTASQEDEKGCTLQA